MKSFSCRTTIRATPERIWAILTDAARYPAWNPTVTRLEGRIAREEAAASLGRGPAGTVIAPPTKVKNARPPSPAPMAARPASGSIAEVLWSEEAGSATIRAASSSRRPDDASAPAG